MITAISIAWPIFLLKHFHQILTRNWLFHQQIIGLDYGKEIKLKYLTTNYESSKPAYLDR